MLPKKAVVLLINLRSLLDNANSFHFYLDDGEGKYLERMETFIKEIRDPTKQLIEELQQFINDPVKMGEWLIQNADAISMGQLLKRFGDEILGDSEKP